MARDYAADIADPIAREIVTNVGVWVDREVKPVASHYEHADEFPEPLVKGMSEMGLFGIKIPEKYGGLDLTFECYAGVCMELARGWMSLAGIINTHVLVGYAISEYGTEEQKQKYLPRLVEPEIRCALSITEPDAGSDAQAIKTTARRDGDDYIINGQKMWVTNGQRAGVYLVLTKTDPEAQPRHRGITAFLVDAGTPGFTPGRKLEKLGYKGVETTELTFDDARVPASQVLGGKEGQGFQHVMSALEVGRINVAARGVGVAQAAFDDAVRYAQKREAFGKPIFEHQAQQLRLAEMITKIRAARLLTLDAARKKDSGARSDLDAGMAKLFATEIAQECVLDAMRIHGGLGYSKELPLERYYRDAPLMVIAEGTSDIQKIVIARNIVKDYPV
ncbi:MAG: acyl-CoA dehydrogenase family protein [Tepidiforma sp.]|jgi:alkylation response protein AidB-like acyl-CoA dehydrogenase|uniref:acyl-CoA dehydrogenase family protein n=1 Tax=Tepidiforma sp. TaxID=2682230 RepID=UPI0021DB9525|nr:acyl-CoA dehydrogenase family protein [Tepidiforma sp.]MCX7617486.1 acyl-CoA dehydrogenase family protein [Tepidiforma sp.]GIW17704.1 MAG: isovaleryl-CoA dehydrogenase [Tepidiforma sp.]